MSRETSQQSGKAPSALESLRRARELIDSARVLAVAGGHAASESAYVAGLAELDAAISAEQERVDREHLRRHGATGALVHDGRQCRICKDTETERV